MVIISELAAHPLGRKGERGMVGFLRKLFGDNTPHEPSPPPLQTSDSPASNTRTGSLAQGRATPAYFAAMVSMQKAIRANDFDTAARHAKDGIRLLPRFVAETRQEFGQFDIRSIPCVDEGGRLFALIGDAAGQAELSRVVQTTPELSDWLPALAQQEHEQALFPRIMQAIADNPGCLQTDLKRVVGEPEGRLIGTLLGYLERAGRIVRLREGRSYSLHLSGSPDAPPTPVRKAAKSHRSGAPSPSLRALDLSRTPYVALPRAPARWENRGEGPAPLSTQEPFEIRDASWSILSIGSIPKADRPDPSFRLTYPSGDGTLILDDLGKAEGLGAIFSAALLYDHEGQPAASAGFDRDLYRLGVHPLGQGLVGMSRDGVLHAYDGKLRLRFETTLFDAPEILAAKRRLGIDDDELRNHIRCIGLSRSGDRYFFTVVDEAWCVSEDGDCLWGVKFPVSPEWSGREKVNRHGTSAEVDAALALMTLALPVTPEDLRTRYRQLAKQWHPDLNPQDASAARRMIALNDACELLTGVDASQLSQDAGLRYFREIGRHEVQVGDSSITVTMGYEVGERSAADWIYAATFAGASNGLYLAGYSGRIVVIDQEGRPLRVYDIGAVPKRIIDLNGYLYLLTDTRLYVLQDDALHALIDVAIGGDLVMSASGFGLLEKKQLRWFSPDGTYLGTVLAKDPIRRVYRAGDALIVETRQTRCSLGGV